MKLKENVARPKFQMRIVPRKSWFGFDLTGIWRRRSLLGLLILRDIRLRYRQTLLGILWTLIQSLAPLLVFVVVFNHFSQFSEQKIPYLLFVYAGLVIWQYFFIAVTQSSNSFINNAGTINKVYFPRLILPLAAVLAPVTDLCAGCLMLLIFRWWNGIQNGWQILLLPVLWFVTAWLALAGGTILASLGIVYRDVRNLLPLALQLLLFLTPIVYPPEALPEKWQWLLKFNPLTGIVLNFRFAFFGGKPAWLELGISVSAAILLTLAALPIFKRMERYLADYL